MSDGSYSERVVIIFDLDDQLPRINLICLKELHCAM